MTASGWQRCRRNRTLAIDGRPNLMVAYQKIFKEHLEHSHEYKQACDK